MRTCEFDYDLPPQLIAQTPVEPRDASRLMVLHRNDKRIEHRCFRDIGSYLEPGDLLVANESRVIPARLFGHKVPTGGRVEMLLLNRRGDQTWEALLKPGRRVKPGAEIAIDAPHGAAGQAGEDEGSRILAKVVDITETGGRLLRFSVPIESVLEEWGIIPLPPYIHTALERPERYQTIYARVNGSVAAPTAGLHFTPELLEQMNKRGIGLAFVTLHVSMDTFRPVQEENLENHHMYSEYCELPPETVAAIHRARAARRRVIAVGTTTVRVLETAGARRQSPDQALQAFSGPSNLFIYPGFDFRVVQGLITNFHLPRSTLLMLVAAFAGKDMIDRAYAEAIRQRYRFYSFGDAMMII